MARLAAVTLTMAVSLGSIGAPAMAASPTRWSSTQCSAWERAFLKRNPHASKSRKAEANKVLKHQACAIRVK
jgi:hypothetical protein